jgi:hypothetical protein
MFDASNDAVWRKVIAFWVHSFTNFVKGVQNTKEKKKFYLQRGFSSQMKMLNDFLTDRDRRKMSTDNLYKSDQNKSNGDVISGLPRPLVAKTTSGQNLTH